MKTSSPQKHVLRNLSEGEEEEDDHVAEDMKREPEQRASLPPKLSLHRLNLSVVSDVSHKILASTEASKGLKALEKNLEQSACSLF